MQMRLVFSTIAMTVALYGCATAYQSKGMTGGFSETMLSPDMFKIEFSGNGFTSAERASDFAILRAADKSLELGCDYFTIVNEANGASVSSVSVGTAGWGRYGAWGITSTEPVVKPNTTLLVKCFSDKRMSPNAFDAHFIVDSIRSKYGINLSSNPANNNTVPALNKAAASTKMTTPNNAANHYIPTSDAEPSPDYADIVIAAQKLSTRMGCGDVKSTGGTTFKAECGAYNVAIDCDGGSCHPTHTIN